MVLSPFEKRPRRLDNRSARWRNELVAALADEVVCLAAPPEFRAVSLWYRSFEQTSDDEVVDLLARANAPARASV